MNGIGTSGRRRIRGSALVVAVSLVTTACGGGGNGADGVSSRQHGAGSTHAPATPIERPSSTAVLEVLRPTNGESIRGSTVPLRLRLTGAEIVDSASTDIRPDEGHLHVLLDDELVSMTGGLRENIRGVSEGSHLLRVEFVASDHAPFDPRIVVAVSFEVRG